ncbi:site-specific DNA-methyltransferase [bacterium]|nr:site-specific DNA-methyltransferase [bacterium]
MIKVIGPEQKKPEKYKIDEIKDTIICGDTLTELKRFPNECIDLVVFSPPYYGLRAYENLYFQTFPSKTEAQKWAKKEERKNPDYHSKIRELRDIEGKIIGWKAIIYSKFIQENQLGLEDTYQGYLDRLVEIFKELKRILKKTGSIWIDIGDTYASSNFGKNKYPSKCLFLIPERLAIRLVDEVGLILRNVVIWAKQVIFEDGTTKGKCMPANVRDRLNVTFEKILFLVKSKRYYFDLDSIRAPFQWNETCQERLGYQGKFSGFGQDAEKFGSPRARNERVSKEQPLFIHPGAQVKLTRQDFETEWEYRKYLRQNNQYQGKQAPQNTIKGSKYEIESYRSLENKVPRNGITPGNTSQIRPEHDIRQWARKGRGSNNPELKNRNWMPIKTKDEILDEEFKKGGMKTAPNPNEEHAFHILGKNPGAVWQYNTKPHSEVHFAIYPINLLERIIKACLPAEICKKCGHIRNFSQTDCKCKLKDKWDGGIVLDPFMGSGTTAIAQRKYQPKAHFIGIEINPEYIKIAKERIKKEAPKSLGI